MATSSDGVNWKVHGEHLARFPERSTQCAVLGNRLVLVIDYGYSISTADLMHWKLERSLPLGSTAPGMAAIDGRLVAVTGQGTSQRFVFRTVP